MPVKPKNNIVEVSGLRISRSKKLKKLLSNSKTAKIFDTPRKPFQIFTRPGGGVFCGIGGCGKDS